VVGEGKNVTVSSDPSQYREYAPNVSDCLDVVVERQMKKRWGEFTNRSGEVGSEEAANPVNGGDDRDSLFRKIKDLVGELFCLVSDVLGGHDGMGRGDRVWVGGYG